MRLQRISFSSTAIVSLLVCSGCAVPYYDVPLDKSGQPTVASIVARVQCEIRDMVRDDRPDDPTTFNRHFLLDGDYDVEVSLSLEVNDTGGLPAFNSPPWLVDWATARYSAFLLLTGPSGHPQD